MSTMTIPPDRDRPAIAVGIERAVSRSGLGRGEFARRCMVSTTSLRLWINGQVEPSDRNLTRVARLLGVTRDDLRNGLPNLYPAA